MSYTITVPDADYIVGVSAVNPDAVCSAFATAEYTATGIKTVADNANAEAKVFAVEGGLFVESAENVAVEVYNAAGQQVAAGVANKAIAAKAGVYVVKAGNKTFKVCVK